MDFKHNTPLATVDDPPSSPLISADAAASYVQLHERTLANYRVLGTGPRYVRVGRRAFYRRADLDAWLDAHVFEHSAAERARRGQEPVTRAGR
jgi:hypothetical protein